MDFDGKALESCSTTPMVMCPSCWACPLRTFSLAAYFYVGYSRSVFFPLLLWAGSSLGRVGEGSAIVRVCSHQVAIGFGTSGAR